MSLTIVNSFTSRPFSGNPAAVALCDSYPDDARLQAIAAEINLSETAFLVARDDDSFSLRWFSPAVEVDLCGHATLASAHVLNRPASFHTRAGRLDCTIGSDGWIEMDFPADPPEAQQLPDSVDVPVHSYFGLARHFALIEVKDAAAVRAYVSDPTLPGRLGSKGLIVTAAGDREGIDCVSRVFVPGVGIPEDPVTGSAHCVLAVYWGERLGVDALMGEQASARGGIVGMRLLGDRVVLRGEAVTVALTEFVV